MRDVEPFMSTGCPAELVPIAGMRHGCMIVPGLGLNKSLYIAAGADLDFLASAMIETPQMDPASYPKGDFKTDNRGNKVPKINDDFNAGACKQNWGMMRQVYGPWKSMKPEQYETCYELTQNRSLDVAIYKQSMLQFGERKFLAGHRNGSTGLAFPNTQDINNFIAAWHWTKDRIASDPDYRTNDVRF
jgi:hypothetical protein